VSDPKLISPLLDNYMMGEAISEKLGIRCCPALERNQQTKCIVKIISTPATQSQLDALLLSGAYTDAQSALNYFQTVADGIADEAKILHRLSQLEGFFSYLNWQIVPMTDGVGFDVYTLSEYRKTLFKLLKGDNLTHLAALNLGLDMCTALAVCRRIGYLYVNLKPENIYLSDNNTWKIGDIGFVRLDSLKYASLPERYRSEYTAPEIEDAFAALNTTLDVYALGIILYRIFNGNQLPANLGNSDNAPLLPPDYADYEMSEIILKACDPDPEKRWQDPIEMGQALVSYMQRNDVNDTPIVPAPIIVEPTPAAVIDPPEDVASAPDLPDADLPLEDNTLNEEIAPETSADELDVAADENRDDISKNISIILTPSDDETAPEQNEDQLDGILVTDEVSNILSQADDLLAHSAPDMDSLNETETVEAKPESVADNSAAPLISETEPAEESSNSDVPAEESVEAAEESTADARNENIPNEHPDTEAATAPDASPVNETADEPVNAEDPAPLPSDSPDSDEDDLDPAEDLDDTSDGTHSHWLRNLLIGVSLLILAVAAFLFYTKYYLQKIDTLDIVKDANGTVMIHIATKTDESKLTVVCSDAYGSQRTASVINGTAVFENLVSGAAYTVHLEIDGFHSLTGKTTASFTTPNQIQILQFTAVTGNEDGSVILSFTTKGQDADNWIVSYTGDDGTEVSENFSGHTHSIQGLTVGNVYTFKLTPETDIKYTGTTEISHKASTVIVPENLQILSIADKKLTASWSAPTDAAVKKWTVRCYSDGSFDKIVEVEEPRIVFEGIDPSAAYTVEVSASGMSVTAHATAPANAITVTNFTATENEEKLIVSWDGNNAETIAWILAFSADNSEITELTCSENNRIEINNRIPGATYAIQLKDSEGNTPLGGHLIFQTSAAEKFSGFGVKAADMRFYACKTPKKSNWSKKDLAASDYTNSFKIGEKVSFLVELKDTYNTSKESVTTMFVIRDQNGSIADCSTSTRTWTQMWYKGLCELDIPSVPKTT